MWYDIDGFLEKNAEKMPDDVLQFMESSSVGLVQLLGAELKQEASAFGASKSTTGASGAVECFIVSLLD